MSGNVVHQDCPYAANPYHECNDRCLERRISIDVSNKGKKPFIFGKLLWRKESESPPISPGSRSSFSSYFAKKRVESDDEFPSFSSSNDTFNANLFGPRSPPHGNKAGSGKNHLIATSSLADYCKKESFAFKVDHREREAAYYNGAADSVMSPRNRPKTPEHPPRTERYSPTSDSRPRTPQHSTISPSSSPRIPEHRYNTYKNSIAPETRHRKPEHASVAIGPKPKAPDTRSRDEERRARSPGYRERSSRQQSKTPEPQGKYLEPLRLETPENKARTQDSKTTTEEYRDRTPDHRARNPRPGSRVPTTQQTSFINEDETQTIMSDTYVSVGSYIVKASVSATLQQIFDKHGDIASGSKLESLSTRSYFLETLAEVVLELQSTPLKKLKVTQVLEMLVVVEDIESVKIRAGWLREILNEILDASRHYDQHKTMVMEKKMSQQDAMLRRQERETILKDLRVKEKEAKKLREGLMETAGRLGELEMKRARLAKRMAFLSSKVGKFEGRSALQKML
ncbi:unnamed protein product [Cochlearia groenlandica]